MSDTEFIILYVTLASVISLLVACFRYTRNYSVIGSAPVSAQVLEVTKDVDVITSIKVKFKTPGTLNVTEIAIDAMYNKTNYEVGNDIDLWASIHNPNLFFLTEPNTVKLIAKVLFQSFVLWFLLCLPIITAFSK